MTSVMKGSVDGVSPDGTLGVGSSDRPPHPDRHSTMAAAENIKRTIESVLIVKGFIKNWI
jgi:hypothetical protein